MNVMGAHHIERALAEAIVPGASGQLISLLCELKAGEWASSGDLLVDYPSLDVSTDPIFSFEILDGSLQVQTLFAFEPGDVVIRRVRKATALGKSKKGRQAA